ncbi:MAG: MazG nucleotide pyrophosphohydrolase domain-containing protein [Armatimonadota bacterium]
MTLREFQRIIDQTYGERDAARGLEGTFMWLVEEVGELARALRSGDHASMTEEFSDVLAWLTTTASLAGVDMDDAAARFERGCPKCGKLPCACNRAEAD